MARIPYPEEDELPDHIRELLDQLAPLNLFRVMAHGENLLRQFTRLGNQLLFKSELDPTLRELSIIRVGLLCDSDYEVHQHRRIASDLGIPEETLEALEQGPDADVFTPEERQVLEFTDAVVKDGNPDDDLFAILEQRYSHRELVELVVCIGYYMMVSRFLEVFDIELEDTNEHLEVG